ncbi:MAG TPA: PfkB family carbohydrate kinase, partial [Tepidisphaeraceae bacterium]|nr:PfkB family carbohydrate kinase [Tepidisphaeraceae bacterium]
MSSRKILTHDQLLAFRARARVAGQRVVHCHGCFDIVHPGHVQHLQFARDQGDVLIVTVSADPHVNKGVERPLIPEELRARNLAALECVDAVYLNRHPTAVELLHELQPDVFIKGAEYERSVDPRFIAERDAVEQHGGRGLFSSNDIVYSSTALISAMRNPGAFFDEKLIRFCRRHNMTPSRVQQITQQFRGQRVVVVGDYLLDRYHFCSARGIAGEAAMMNLQQQSQTDYDGGAAIIAQHLNRLGAHATLLTSLADDAEGRALPLRLRAHGVEVRAIDQRRQTVIKSRFLADDAKVFTPEIGHPAPVDSLHQRRFIDLALESARGADAVIFADFGYGLLTPGMLDALLPKLRPLVRTISADVSGRQNTLLRFVDVDLLCPTERELREALHEFGAGVGTIASNLLTQTRARHAIITVGRQGLVACDWPEGGRGDGSSRVRTEYLPSLVDRAIDPLGCGDALLAAATLTLTSGGGLAEAAFVGSLAAACEAQRVGNVAIGAD